jgi:CheY-like chemotaxis protein
MMQRHDILVVDDEQVILDAVKKICTLEHLSIDIASEAASVLEKIERNSYRLILCDIMMPGISGFQFLFELQKMGIDIPIIMITGYTTTENTIVSLRNGAIDFLPKPFTIDELWSTIKRGLRYGDIYHPQTTPDSKSYGLSDAPAIQGRCYRLGFTTWMKVSDNGLAGIGITSRYLRTIEEIDQLELLEINEKLSQGNFCARLRGLDGFTYVLQSPVSGKIIERNEILLNEPKLLRNATGAQSWLYNVIPAELEYEIRFLNTSTGEL